MEYFIGCTNSKRFVMMPVEKFLMFVPLSYILEFFQERVDVLYEFANELYAQNKQRERFLLDFHSWIKNK
jgi:hypothetical protein